MSRVPCPGCAKQVSVTNSGKYWKHGGGECDFSGTVIPPEGNKCNESSLTVTSKTASSAPPPEDAAPESAASATPSTHSPPGRPEPVGSAASPTLASATDALPGIDGYSQGLNDLAATQLAAYRAKVEAGLTPFSQPAPVDVEQPTIFSQPAGARSEAPAEPMSDLGKELTARLRELFYAWDNRRSADNRSAQATMGPSEMGHKCDRRIALSLLRQPPVNPGGDGFAAFVGTMIHKGLEELFEWANADTGRFATEQRLKFDSEYVPKGTADLIDRTLLMLADHKCLGRWSRNKFKSQGPSQHYRVQGHVYAYGARLRGERIEKVAWFLWPRDEASLEDLYVHVEDYNPQIAKDAFERVERIGGEVSLRSAELRETYSDAPDWEIGARVGLEYEIDTEGCRFCPFHLPNARSPLDGCNGKK